MKHVLIRMLNAFVLALLLVELVGYAIFDNPLFKRTPIPSPEEIVRDDDPAPTGPVGSPGEPDSDSDGIPDSWEVAHFLNPNDVRDAASDFDGDGLTAKQEFETNTDHLGNWVSNTIILSGLPGNIHYSSSVPIKVIDVNSGGAVALTIPIEIPDSEEIRMTSWYYTEADGLIEIGNNLDYDIEVFDLNDQGVAVGRMVSKVDWSVKGFIWQNGSLSDLTTPDLVPAVATRINNRGNWVGFEQTQGWAPVAVINEQTWRNQVDPFSGLSTSDLFGGLPVVNIIGINENDQVLAAYVDFWNSRYSLAVSWNGYIESSGFPVPMLTSPSPQGYNDAVINIYGEFAAAQSSGIGSYFFDGGTHPFSGNEVHGLSDDGMVVSSYAGVAGAFVWSNGVEAPIAPALMQAYTARSAAISSNEIIAAADGFEPSFEIIRKDQDQDRDGLPDDWETYYGLNPNNSADAHQDLDGDRVSNLGEFLLHSDPAQVTAFNHNGNTIDIRPGIDSDGDGIPNVWEWSFGLSFNDPTDAGKDFDRDGFTNLQEYHLNTNPISRPTYRVHELGPYPEMGALEFGSAALAAGRPIESFLTPIDSTVTESVYFSGAASAASGYRPVRWTQTRSSEPSHLTIYPGSAYPGLPIAASSTGAALQQTASYPATFQYWATPSSNPVELSGLPWLNNIADLYNSKFSPSGKFLVGVRVQASDPSSYQQIVWRMPEGSQTFEAVVLTPPEGVTVSPWDPLYVNDYGFVIGNGISDGQSVAVMWSFGIPSNSATPLALTALEGGSFSMARGLSNHASPLIGGVSSVEDGQTHATVWNASGQPSDLGGLSDWTSSEILAVSPGGYLAGSANVLVDGSIQILPFIATPNILSTLDTPDPNGYVSVLQEAAPDGCGFSISSISDAGEMIGLSYFNSYPISWFNGRYAICGIRGYEVKEILSVNSNGSFLVRATKNGIAKTLLLSREKDTDGDDLPDDYENQYGLNSFQYNNPNSDDDGDGMSNVDELYAGTNPKEADSDSDGTIDGSENQVGRSPLKKDNPKLLLQVTPD